ncbi:hypothetical protein ACSSS7_005534 [Eimeria intestinalis]
MASSETVSEAFLSLDASLLQAAPAQYSGTTAVVALIEELKEPRQLVVSGREVLSEVTGDTLFQKLDPADRVGSAVGQPQLAYSPAAAAAAAALLNGVVASR